MKVGLVADIRYHGQGERQALSLGERRFEINAPPSETVVRRHRHRSVGQDADRFLVGSVKADANRSAAPIGVTMVKPKVNPTNRERWHAQMLNDGLLMAQI